MKQPFTLMNRALVALVLLAGCEEHLPLVGAPCPCAPGTVCDPATSRCVMAPVGPDDAAVADALISNDVLAPQPPSDAPAAPPPGMGACKSLGFTSASDFEVRFIVPRCGTAKCHGPMSVFPPRNLDMPTMIRANLIGKRAALNCKNDYYVDPINPARSVMLSTVWAFGDQTICPSGGPGGTRMPNKEDMPTIVGTRLTEAELECFTWWVYEIATF
jgi:hypothetical protein